MIIQKLTSIQQGIDIIARKKGSKSYEFHVEAKGETSARKEVIAMVKDFLLPK